MSRPLRPHVNTVGDNPIVQIKCEPDKDEVNIEALLNEVMVRFELQLGTSFDLQFLSMDGTRLLAMRRFIVAKAVEELVTSHSNFGQTMTRTVNHRGCETISDWFIFDEVAEVLRSGPAVDVDFDLDTASPAFLQEFVKSKRGKGFRPGTSHADMIKEAKKYL